MEGVPIHEIDPNFEPQPRARSNTWPVRPREVDADSEGARTPNSVHSENDKQESEPKVDGKVDQLALSQKKGGSRRNAWGNLSYADLITKAIQSSPEGRLTLSQIYDWMVQNVPYFRDKGDSNSSAGWKNSIRHNLSLHSRFMRVQNEGTGKSSWWVINPEAKPGKSPRRRATSMDTKEYVKKRGRVKRKVDQLRAAMEGAAMENGGNFGSAQELSNFVDPFALSPQDYRQRTASNASSIGPPGGGRLTPIEGYEDFDDQLPGGLSPVSWNQNPGPMGPGDHGFNDISESLAGMLMADNNGYRDPSIQDGMVTSSMQNASPLGQQLSPSGYPDQNASYLQIGPAYPGVGDNMRQISPQQLSPQNVVPPQCNRASPVNTMSPNPMGKSPNGYHPASGPIMNNMNNMMRHPPPQQQRRFPMHQSLTELLEQPDEPMDQNPIVSTAPQTLQSQTRPNSTPFMNNALNNGGVAANNRNNMLLGGLDMSNLTTQQRNQLTTSLLRQVLTESATAAETGNVGNMNAAQAQNKQAFLSQNGLTAGQTSTILMSGGSMQSQGFPTTMGGNAAFPPQRSGSELEFLDINPAEFLSECPDVDQVLSHELSLDPNLDFNFDGSSQQQQPQMGSNTDVTQPAGVFNGALPKLASL